MSSMKMRMVTTDNGESTAANEVKVDNNPDEPLSNEHNEISIQTTDEANEVKPDSQLLDFHFITYLQSYMF